VLPEEKFVPENETGTDGVAPKDLDKALLGGEPARVGRFAYNYNTEAWTWSSTVARIHGYEPGEVQPTTELVLSHKHPDDLAKVKALLKRSSAPFSSRHRIRTKSGQERNVVVVGEIVNDENGDVAATRGFYIDVTKSIEEAVQEGITEELEDIVAHRATIEQAKGMLMAVYDLRDDSAFDVLRWRSQELNVKLHGVAEEIVAQLPGLLNLQSGTRGAVDHLLMTLSAPEDDDDDLSGAASG
jgi:PAS domain S-box-containing protein